MSPYVWTTCPYITAYTCTYICEHIHMFKVVYIPARIHIIWREGGHLILTIACTNTLHKDHIFNYWVLLFYINTYRVTKDLLIGINSFVILHKVLIMYCSCDKVEPIRNAEIILKSSHPQWFKEIFPFRQNLLLDQWLIHCWPSHLLRPNQAIHFLVLPG